MSAFTSRQWELIVKLVQLELDGATMMRNWNADSDVGKARRLVLTADRDDLLEKAVWEDDE